MTARSASSQNPISNMADHKRRLRRAVVRCGVFGLAGRFVGVLVDHPMLFALLMALLVRLVVLALVHGRAEVLECTTKVTTEIAQALGPEHHHDDGEQDQKLPNTDSTKHNYLYLSLTPNSIAPTVRPFLR